MKARIGIGALLGIMGGPATYAAELVRALASHGQHDYIVFTDRPQAFREVAVETVAVPLGSTYHQVAWDHVGLRARLCRAGVAVYHGTKGILPVACPVPAVVTVHDLAVYACPETFAWPQRVHFRLCVPPSVARARLVIADSEHARGDLIARFGLAPGRVRTVPCGVAERFRTPVPTARIEALRADFGLGSQIIACVGTVQPRKHVERAIDAFVRAGAHERGWQLVIAGRVRPGYAPGWMTSPPAGVRWLGPLEDGALGALYAAAGIAISASEYEGFGLTVGEAMAAGAAIVAVGVTSVPEVVGDAGILVPASDPLLLADALRRLIDDASLREDLGRRACVQASRFTWSEAARTMAALYDEVLGS